MVIGAAGGLRITRRNVDLKRLCERVLDAIQTAYPENMFAFDCDPSVEGEWDPESIASLLSRLVMNAIQHGAAKRTIRVSLSDLDDVVALVVTNDGPPFFDDTTAGGAFRPFGGKRRAGGAGRQGLGLGLYLSREIVRAHGGRIEARCANGRVSVSVRLPRACSWIYR